MQAKNSTTNCSAGRVWVDPDFQILTILSIGMILMIISISSSAVADQENKEMALNQAAEIEPVFQNFTPLPEDSLPNSHMFSSAAVNVEYSMVSTPATNREGESIGVIGEFIGAIR